MESKNTDHKNQTIMKKNSKVNLEEIESNFYLHHLSMEFEKTSKLHERSFVLTVQLDHIIDYERICKVIFIKTNRVIFGTASDHNPNRATMLLAPDVEGTRQHKGAFRRPVLPHIHGLLIISERDEMAWRGREELLMSNCREAISSIKEVQRARGRAGVDRAEVFIDKFDLRRNTLQGYIGYITKASRQANRLREYFPEPHVYPSEIDASQKKLWKN